MTVEIVRVDQSLRNAGLILPEWILKGHSNLALPDEADIVVPTALQNYPLGAQLKMNGKLYRYSKAGAAMLTGTGFLKVNSIIVAGKVGNSLNSGYEGAIYADAAVGATELKITDTAAVKNEYEGARLVIGNDTLNTFIEHRVVGNDVSTGVYTVIKIAPPGLQFAVTTTNSTLGISLNPYYRVKSGLVIGCVWYSAIGMARFPVADGYFFWLQTAGPCGGTGASTWPGQTGSQRDVMANTDGSLIGLAAATTYYQRIGFLLSGSASDYGTTFINLQLDQ